MLTAKPLFSHEGCSIDATDYSYDDNVSKIIEAVIDAGYDTTYITTGRKDTSLILHMLKNCCYTAYVDEIVPAYGQSKFHLHRQVMNDGAIYTCDITIIQVKR